MLEALIRGTKKLSNPKEIERLIVEAASMHEAEAIDLNQSQLRKGIYADGSRTPIYSNSEYGKYKRSIGSKSGNHYDYHLEGDFYEGEKIKFENDYMMFYSTDSKAELLTSPPYGSDEVYGLTEENKTEFGEIIIDNFLKLFENELTK